AEGAATDQSQSLETQVDGIADRNEQENNKQDDRRADKDVGHQAEAGSAVLGRLPGRRNRRGRSPRSRRLCAGNGHRLSPSGAEGMARLGRSAGPAQPMASPVGVTGTAQAVP